MILISFIKSTEVILSQIEHIPEQSLVVKFKKVWQWEKMHLNNLEKEFLLFVIFNPQWANIIFRYFWKDAETKSYKYQIQIIILFGLSVIISGYISRNMKWVIRKKIKQMVLNKNLPKILKSNDGDSEIIKSFFSFKILLLSSKIFPFLFEIVFYLIICTYESFFFLGVFLVIGLSFLFLFIYKTKMSLKQQKIHTDTKKIFNDQLRDLTYNKILLKYFSCEKFKQHQLQEKYNSYIINKTAMIKINHEEHFLGVSLFNIIYICTIVLLAYLKLNFIYLSKIVIILWLIQDVFNILEALQKMINIKYEQIKKFENLQIPENGTEDFINGDIHINDLNVTFGDKKILNNVNLKIKQGEKIAIMGKSGCGKTTLLKCILKDLDYTGLIEIGHINHKKLKTECLMENIGLLFQAFFKDSIINNLTLGKEIPLSRIKKVLSITCVDFINDFQKEFKYEEFSSGQLQRLAIARALLNGTNILLLDEPTNFLDKNLSEKIISNIIKEYSNSTIITVTHDHQILHYFHKIYEVNEGSLMPIIFNNEYSLFPSIKKQNKIIDILNELIEKKFWEKVTESIIIIFRKIIIMSIIFYEEIYIKKNMKENGDQKKHKCKNCINKNKKQKKKDYKPKKYLGFL